jgi:peptidoglycan/LPS O-acetylase OafA/YrhL
MDGNQSTATWTTKSRATDLPQLTGLRGLAALLVLFYHVRTPQGHELSFGVVDAFSKFGSLGVDTFFVLSGFILGAVYGQMFARGYDSSALRAYGRARFARIYPLHFITLFLMLGAYAVALRVGVHPTETSGYGWRNLVLALLLVHEWIGIVAPNPGSWSISIELANYLIFPLLIMRPRVPAFWALLAIIVGAAVVEYFSDDRVFRSMTEFVMGYSAYRIATIYRPGASSALAGIAFVVPFVASGVVGRELPGLAAIGFTASMFLMSGSVNEPFRIFCASRPLVFFGEISYSIYLLQWLVWIGWKHGLAKLPFFAAHLYAMVFFAATTVVLCAIPSYYFFEKPARAFLRRVGGRRTAHGPVYS